MSTEQTPSITGVVAAAALRNRYRLVGAVDAVLWLIALPAATYARFEFSARAVDVTDLGFAVLLAIGVHLVTGFVTGLYVGRRRVASFEEMGWVATTTAVTEIVLFLALVVPPGDNLVPRSALLAAGAYHVLGALAVRFMLRVIEENRRRSEHPRANRILVFGAGDAGHQAVKAIREDPTSDLLPVAFLDDDPARRRLKVAGLPVVGDRTDIGDAAAKFQAGSLLIAMPSADRSAVLEVADTAQGIGLSVRILPPMDKFLTEPVAFRDIRELTLADFLSRDEIHLDDARIRGYLTGKTVLVTGAGGSIGGQLCETVRQYAPGRLLMLDHAENSLHALQLRLDGRALLENPELVLADIRDLDALRAVFAEHRPDVVFHAAAHKHVTFLERHPVEGIKTNVFGVENVLRAAVESNVERFVNVSTDKAADPINVLGMTKRIGERLTAYYGTQASGVYMSVRFGNVLGSNGSVIPTFRDQIARGEPITVTHPDVTRYFMTIPEAVQLVLQAGAVGEDGDVLVLDMGEPVKIVDLAHRLAAEIDPGTPPTIVFTGLRPGEKLHEVLINDHDEPLDRPHELLLRYRVPAVEPAEVHAFLDHASDPIAAMEKLAY